MNILVIDDDPKFLQQAKDVFAGLGHRVVPATDGKQGVSLFLQGRYALVLVDALLPKLSGEEVVKEILKSRRGTSVHCVLVSGIYRQKSAQAQLQTSSGAVDFVSKPLTQERAHQLIQQYGKEDSAGGGFSLSVQPGELTTDGPLNPMEFDSLFQMNQVGKIPPFKFLWWMAHCGRSGSLTFVHDNQEVQACFHKGSLVQVLTTGQKFNFGDLLVNRGYITRDDLHRALIHRKDQELIGHFLVQNSLISPHVVDEILYFQQFERLAVLADWPLKSFRYEEADFSSMKPMAFGLPKLMADLCLTRVSKERLKAYIQDLRLFEVRPVRSVRLPKEVTLRSGGQDILQALLQPPMKEVKNILSQFSKSEETALRVLYLLDCFDVIRYGKVGQRNIKATSMEKLALDYRDMDFLERLGLTREASVEDVKERFRVLSKQYHPDVLDRSTDPSTVQAYGKIFDLISEAYEALQDGARLAKFKQFGKIVETQDVAEGESAFSEGQRNFFRKNYGSAAQNFKRAFDSNPENGTFLAYYCWAQLYLTPKESPDFKSRIDSIRKELERSLSLSPESAVPHLVLGSLYKVVDDMEKAESAFRDALDIDPENRDAQRELRLLTMREAEKSKGLKVFGIKIR